MVDTITDETIEEQFCDLISVEDSEVVLHMPTDFEEFRFYRMRDVAVDELVDEIFAMSDTKISQWSLRGFFEYYKGKDIPFDKEWFVGEVTVEE